MAADGKLQRGPRTVKTTCTGSSLSGPAIDLLQSRLGLPCTQEYETLLTTEESDDDSNDAGEPDLHPKFTDNWKAVLMNPCDFDGWIKLLDSVEKEDHLLSGRKVYEAFLRRYPYCFGYWKKYANLEHHFKNTAEALQVFKRGSEAVPLSVDLWLDYIKYLTETMDMTLPESVEQVRSVFKSALAAAGLEFCSDKLWIKYTEWEEKKGNLKELTAIYDRVLSIPTQLYRQHHDRFKQLVASQPPCDILTPEEFHWIYSKLKNEESEQNDQIATEDSPSENDQEDMKQFAEHREEKIREQILKIREQLFLLNEAEVQKRWNFEAAIMRPYFHATPLELSQLQNWRNYLEFETSQGQHERIVTLYERCLVACALYEDFWLEYARYLECHSVEDARNVLKRACHIHLPLKPSIHLHWAIFEEKHGQLDAARTILQELEQVVPNIAMVRLRRANLERRSGNMDEAIHLLHEAMRQCTGSELSAFYAIKLARLLLKVQGNPEKARSILTEALENEPDNPRLHLCLLEFEVSRNGSEGESDALICVERALRCQLHNDIKLILSQRRLEFLEDRGSSVTSLLSAYEEHQELQKKDLKRRGENGNNKEPKEKVPRTETSIHASPVASVAPSVLQTIPMNIVPFENTPHPSHLHSPWLQPLVFETSAEPRRQHFRPPPPYYRVYYSNYEPTPPPWNYNRFYHPH